MALVAQLRNFFAGKDYSWPRGGNEDAKFWGFMPIDARHGAAVRSARPGG
jgi:hypothetical protein